MVTETSLESFKEIKKDIGRRQKMVIANTSIESYKEILTNISKRQKEVYQVLLSLKCANNLMISKKSGIPLQSVCGRMNELRNKLKLVTFSHIGKCPYTLRSTQYWKCINR